MKSQFLSLDMLQYRSDTEAILSKKEYFNLYTDNKFSSSEDGCYLVFDCRRETIIKVDTTYNGYTIVWDTHRMNSNLTSIQNRSDKFCYLYPSDDCEDVSLLTSSNVRGKFSDLCVRKGIVMKKEDLKEICALFTWKNAELASINNLRFKANRYSIETKKYYQILDIFAIVHNLSIDQGQNMSKTASGQCLFA